MTKEDFFNKLVTEYGFSTDRGSVTNKLFFKRVGYHTTNHLALYWYDNGDVVVVGYSPDVYSIHLAFFLKTLNMMHTQLNL